MLPRLRRRIFLVTVCLVLPGLIQRASAQVVQDEPAQARPPQAAAEEQPQAKGQPQADPPTDGPESVEIKRAWLRGVLSAQMSNERQLRLMNARVTEMSEVQLDRAIAAQKRKLRKIHGQANQADQQVRQQLAVQQNRERQALQAIALGAVGRNQWRAGFVDGFVLGHRDPVIAYAPGLTWLPSGSRLLPRPIVTWGGRRVFVDTWPIWSHVPARHFVSPVVESPILPPEEQQQPRVWYDGLRTRFGVPSGPFKDRF